MSLLRNLIFHSWCLLTILLRFGIFTNPRSPQTFHNNHTFNLWQFARRVTNIKPTHDILILLILESKVICSRYWKPCFNVFESNLSDRFARHRKNIIACLYAIILSRRIQSLIVFRNIVQYICEFVVVHIF